MTIDGLPHSNRKPLADNADKGLFASSLKTAKNAPRPLFMRLG
jgi:hypothetical protein